jgi:hypothetical protein
MNRHKFSWLKRNLAVVIQGDNDALKELKFEDMYREVFNLCMQGKGKTLLVVFRRFMSRGVALHRKDRDQFVTRARMLVDVFMYAFVTRFGTCLKGSNKATDVIEAEWDGRKVTRGMSN